MRTRQGRGAARCTNRRNMEDKDQWVGVAPCVGAGIRSLLSRFEDQQAALDEAASRKPRSSTPTREGGRCEALEAQIVAARREATEAREDRRRE